ncbi:phosphatase PAP2 family protein [Vibrio profundi]|uniref:phosphatase PAP2 family protein n=1 Tax=Vibrio profundi TaxID=1774960 RepID=UPI003736D4EB
MTSKEANKVWNNIKELIQADKLIYLFIATTSVLFYLASFLVNAEQQIEYSFFLYLKVLAETCYFTFIIWCTYYYFYLLFHRASHPTRKFIAKIKSFFNPPYQLIGFVLLLLALNLTFSCYTYLKSIIPSIHYFSWDLAFYQLDKALHFGISPWEITHAIFSSPWSSFVINFFYHLWFFFMWATVLFFIVNKSNAQLRTQFLLSFLACWLLIGGVAAVLLSSAGPCYIHLLNAEFNFYHPLLERLTQQSNELVSHGWFPLWILDVQDMLWQSYVDSKGGAGAGISAMPSMHVSIAVLMALSLSKVNSILGNAMWLFALIIQIGSVHLAWHYAVDGYMSFILTTAIWFLCGKVVRWNNPTPAVPKAVEKDSL